MNKPKSVAVPSKAALASSAVGPTPSGCTHFRLRQLSRRIGQLYDQEMARIGLKTTQYSLLSHVLKLGPLAPGALARAMTMEPSTLTRNLKPLIAAGWVALAEGADARSRSVSITAAGRDKRLEAQRRWKVAQENVNRLLGAEHVVVLHEVLDESLLKLAEAGAVDDDE